MVPMKVNTLDRYEILGELGRGAISIVYDARDLLTDDPVALKLIEPSLSGAADFSGRTAALPNRGDAGMATQAPEHRQGVRRRR